MTISFKIRVVKVGNSLRITIPKEIVDMLKLQQGDTVKIFPLDDRFTVKKFDDV